MRAEKAGIMKPEETASARQRLGKQISATTIQYAKIYELLKTVFYMCSVARVYSEGHRDN
jgi:hypothetical protein